MPAATAKAKQKSSAQLSESDVRYKCETWARYQRHIKVAEQEKEQDPQLIAASRKVEELEAKHDERIDALQEKADAVHAEVVAWLESRQPKKSVLEKIVEGTKWIAKLVRGKKKGPRLPDPQKFIARCKALKKDPWKAVVVVIKDGEPILGKDDFDKICTKPDVPLNDATLELK